MSTTFTLEPVGTRFGGWTVRDHTVSNQHGMRQAVVECDCGRFAVVIMANLREGKSTKCHPCSIKTSRTRLQAEDRAPNATLRFDQVVSIKARIAAGETLVSIAGDYRISDRTVSNIKCGRNWRHVPWPESYAR